MAKMTEKQIKERIDEILADKMMSYVTANIYTNAPLALMQISMETELHTLQRVLGIELTDINVLRNKKN